jgi:hypothetical protein
MASGRCGANRGSHACSFATCVAADAMRGIRTTMPAPSRKSA